MLTVWGLAGSAVAVLLEYWYRTWTGTWLDNIGYWFIPYMFVSYCIYKIVTTPQTSLIEAFIVWAFSTMVLRTLVSVLILHEPIYTGTWVALALVILARISQSYWR